MDRCWGEIQQKGFKLPVFKSRVPNRTSDIVSDCLHTVGCCVLTNYKYTNALLNDELCVCVCVCVGSTHEWRWARHWLLLKSRWVILFLQVQTWFSCIILEHLLINFCLHCSLDMGRMLLISIFQRIRHILLKKKL